MKNTQTVSALVIAAVAALLSSSAFLFAHPSPRPQSPQQSKPTATPPATTAPGASTFVVPDLAERVAKFKVVRMPFHSKGLSAKEIKLVDKLVDAAGLADCIYWRQSDPEGLKLYLSLADSTNPQDKLVREYLKINGSRYDLINDNKPFVGTEPMPPGHAFYPEGFTQAKLDSYVAA